MGKLDPLLNEVVGYGATPETLSQHIQRGKFGMDGMYCQGGFRISNPKVRSNFQIRASQPGLTQPMGTNYHIWKVILHQVMTH